MSGLARYGIVVLIALAAHRAEAAPAAQPADVLAVLTLPSIDRLGGVGDFADRIQPGSSVAVTAMLQPGLAELVGARGLDGIALGKPVRLVVLDPPGGSVTPVLVVPVRDGKALARAVGPGAKVRTARGWAVIGPAPAVARVAPWVLATLVLEKAPAAPTAAVFPAAILAAHRTAIDQLGPQMIAAMAAVPGSSPELNDMMTTIADGLIEGLESSARFDLHIEATADLASIDLAATPRRSTRLHALVAAQQPSTFPLLSRLPLDGAMVVAAGRWASGPLRPAFQKLMEPLFEKSLGHPLDDGERAAMNGMWDAVTGEIALTAVMNPPAPSAGKPAGRKQAAAPAGPPMSMAALYQVTDAKVAASHADKLAAALAGGSTTDLGGVKLRMQISRDKAAIDGVKFIHSTMTFDYRGLGAAEAARMRATQGDRTEGRWGVWDDVMGFVGGPDSLAAARKLVAVSRGKAKAGPLPAALAALVDDARAHRDSIVFVYDVGALIATVSGKPASSVPAGGAAFATSFGFADARAHLRVTVPSVAVTTLMRMQP